MSKQDAFYAAKEMLSTIIDNENMMIIFTYEEMIRQGRSVPIPKLKKGPSLKKIKKLAKELEEVFAE